MPDKILQDAENLVNYVHTLRQQGAKLLTSPQDIVPPTAGIWGSEFAEWEPEKEYKKGELFCYQGCVGYVKQPSLTAQEIYPPFSSGTEALYGARPIPDAQGVYPYIYNMGLFEGMLVRAKDGRVYRSKTGSYESPTELLYRPEDVPALLELVSE